MAASAHRRHQRASKQRKPAASPIGWSALLAPPTAVVVIAGLAFAASLAQATAEVFVAASLVFSLSEGVVLAIVGFAWSKRGALAAVVAGSISAAVAAPVRWEVAAAAGYIQSAQPGDLVADLLLSTAWGALAGLAGATLLRSRLATLMHADQDRFPR